MDERRYEEVGASAAVADWRAGNSFDGDIDEGAILQWVGLDDGGAETLMLLDLGNTKNVDTARAAVLRGYYREVRETIVHALEKQR